MSRYSGFVVSYVLLVPLDTHVQYSNCTTGDIRLIGGRTLTEGRIEICIEHVWGYICDNEWDVTDANIVCLQLGLYPSGNLINST